jgi:SRSO17 transposase
MKDVAKRYVELGEGWREDLECLFSYISRHFGRIDRQRHAWEYLLGLLSPVERKNGWQLAEAAEHVTPYSLQHLLDRAPWDANAAWIAGDEIYGDNRSLRVWLEQQGLHFVLAVRSNHHVWTEQMRQETVEQLAQAVKEQDWQGLSAGNATKGPRWYDWARIPLLSWQMPGQRWLLLRKGRSDGKLAYYVCYTPVETELQTMVQVAGMRWMVEECFEAAKGEVGLDHYEVRSWHGWYRHITLAMLAHAFLAALCTSAAEADPLKKKMPDRMEKSKQQPMHASH